MEAEGGASSLLADEEEEAKEVIPRKYTIKEPTEGERSIERGEGSHHKT